MELEKKLFDMKVNYITENFDYDQVIKVMNFLEWKWYGIIDVGKKELEEEIIKLFSEIYIKRFVEDVKIDSISTGGLKCSIITYDGGYRLECDFILTDWSTDCYEDDPGYIRVKNLSELINM